MKSTSAKEMCRKPKIEGPVARNEYSSEIDCPCQYMSLMCDFNSYLAKNQFLISNLHDNVININEAMTLLMKTFSIPFPRKIRVPRWLLGDISPITISIQRTISNDTFICILTSYQLF